MTQLLSNRIAATVVPVASTVTSGTITLKAPTQQIFTSGTAQTYTTPTGALWLKVRMVGGGGGGSGSGSTTPGAATAGTQSVFGTSLLTATGGAQGVWGTGPGTGGSPTINSPAVGFGWTGGAGSGYGSQDAISTAQAAGGIGGSSGLGGGGGSGGSAGVAGGAAGTNSGSGGGGGGGGNAANDMSGPGGGSGAFIDAIIPSPSATYTYTVGAAGTGGLEVQVVLLVVMGLLD